jgi:hypothetical protein
MTRTFVTRLHREKGRDVCGIVVPAEILEALGGGRRPAVKVTLGGYSYRSTVGSMGGKSMISLSAAHRAAAGLAGSERLEVRLELDTQQRLTPLPDDLRSALVRAGKLAAFEEAAPSRRREHVRQVETAKAPATRARRIARIVEALP